jgi:predicted alpha/beta-hydrolase family hydrolase
MTAEAFNIPGDAPATHSARLYRADGAAKRNVLLVLAHGAGAGQLHPFMVRYAQGLADRGLDVVTFNFPYIDAGRRAPDRAPVLEDAFRRVIVAATAHRDLRAHKLYIGGKSMGGRMATHVAAAQDQWPDAAPPLDGVVVFGYPLNPPGGPSRRSPDRTSHLAKIDVPILIVQGTRDQFGGPDAIKAALELRPVDAPLQGRLNHKARAAKVLALDGADHSPKSKYDQAVFDGVVDFVSST